MGQVGLEAWFCWGGILCSSNRARASVYIVCVQTLLTGRSNMEARTKMEEEE